MASAGSKRQKRAHKTLTIDKKLEVLAQIGKKSYTSLCEMYGVGRSTIGDLKKQEPALRAYKRRMKDLGVKLLSAKIMKLGKDEHLETALYIWFKQKREEGVPITGSIIRAKALDLHRQLHSHSDEMEGDGSVVDSAFMASTGWIWRFGKHHNIRQLSLQGEKLSADQPAADQFVPEFQAFIAKNGYSLDQVFNCDESGLHYKLLPNKSLVTAFEKSAAGRKRQKEHVIINACSNASGTIKLPLLLIGKSKKHPVLQKYLSFQLACGLR